MFNIYDEAIRSTELSKRVWLCLTAFFSRAIRPWHTLQQLVLVHGGAQQYSTLALFSFFGVSKATNQQNTHNTLVLPFLDNWCTYYYVPPVSGLLVVSHVSLFLFTNATTVKYVVIRSSQRSSRATECSTGCSSNTIRLSNAFGKPRKQLATCTSFHSLGMLESDEKINLLIWYS